MLRKAIRRMFMKHAAICLCILKCNGAGPRRPEKHELLKCRTIRLQFVPRLAPSSIANRTFSGLIPSNPLKKALPYRWAFALPCQKHCPSLGSESSKINRTIKFNLTPYLGTEFRLAFTRRSFDGSYDHWKVSKVLRDWNRDDTFL